MKIKLFIVTACLALSACSGGFSKGVRKDLATGLSASYNGLTLSDIYLVMDSARAKSNKIPLGKKLVVEAQGVDFFAVEQGKVFPGCSIVLLDKAGKELLNIADAFEHLNGGTNASEATVLDATLNTGEPMEVGKTYILKVRFFDKKKKENEILSQIELVMI
jgi:hypothetical protein